MIVDPAELELALAVADPAAEEDITSRRNVEILRSYAEREPSGHERRVVLRFLVSPTELKAGEDGRVTSVEFVRNQLVAAPDGRLRAEPTDERETIPAGLVFRAIGYRGLPLPGVPFDERAGTIPHESGRVLETESREPVRREYVVGWIKRGPSGVIGTNKKDAQETVDAILADLPELANGDGPSNADAQAAEALLRERRPNLVEYTGWEAIDRHEQALGAPAGRPRVKLTTIDELLRVAAAEEP